MQMSAAIPIYDPALKGESDLEQRSWIPLVSVFLLVFIISYVDRQILSLVVQPVKTSLRISDFQIGLLQGFAFSIVLAVASMVTAPLVDRNNRVRVLATCMLVWCVMTILCGFATSFLMLLVARTGLAIAEAVVPVAVLSIICDIAPRRSVPRASALVMAAPYFGSGFALLAGGPILAMLAPFEGRPMPIAGTFEAWRGLFFMLGIPGILVALLIFAFVREPRRRAMSPVDDKSDKLWPFLREHAGFLAPMFLANSMFTLISYTAYAWTPTFMIRAHGLSASHVGVTVGPTFVIAGVSGCLFGSWIMGRSNPRLLLSHVVRTIAWVLLCLSVPLILFPAAPSEGTALALLAAAFFLLAAGLSSVMTPVSLFAPARLRGRVMAAAVLTQAAIAGCGPLIVGAINDFVFEAPDKIGYSLMIVYALACAIGLIAIPRVVRMARAFDDGRAEAVA